MGFLKSIIMSLLFACFIPSAVFADMVDDELPASTPLQIKEKARQAIHAGTGEQDIVKMTQTMLKNRFTEQQIVRACDIIIDAESNDIPAGPVMNKLYEGIGKRVQSGNIVMAMEKVRERYKISSKYAHQINSSKDQAEGLMLNIAECLAAGMSEDDIAGVGEKLNQLKTQNENENATLQIRTFMAVKTMSRMGADSASVTEAVETALSNGYGASEMQDFEQAFVLQARRFSDATDVAKSFTRGIRAGMSSEELTRAAASGVSVNAAMGGNGNGYGNAYGSDYGAGGTGSGSGMGSGSTGSGSGGSGYGSGGSSGAGGSGGSGSAGSAGGSGGGGSGRGGR